jgi:pimeloyl-ACP methyl ester carboxylesterase
VEVLRWPIFGRAVQSVATDKAQVRTVLKKVYFHDELIPDESVDAYAAALGMPGGKHALRETAKAIIPDDVDALTEAYKRIAVPTLIIWGRHDEIVPLAIGRRLRDTIAGSSLDVIDDAGHAPQEETPDEVRPLLLRFLR